MSSVIGPSAINYGALFSASGAASWISDAYTAIQNQANQGGLLGMLQNAASNDGSLNSFLSNSQNAANSFALISQNSLTSSSTLYAQMAASLAWVSRLQGSAHGMEAP